MSEHLPQCHMRHGLPASAPCMCEMISAYKKRLRAPEEAAYQKGYAAALTAARDAVEKVGQQHPKWDLISTHYEGCWKSHPECALTLALAAIDNLTTKIYGE